MIDVKKFTDYQRIRVRHFVLQNFDYIRKLLENHESLRFEYKEEFGFTLHGFEDLEHLLKEIK